MGVYINMEMPKSCGFCALYDWDYWWCRALGREVKHAERDNVRHYDCPLFPIPPHGRLIDADALVIDLMDRGIEGLQTDDFYEIQQAVADAPTIIPAEVET